MQKRNDVLQEYAAAHVALQQEREQLQKRIQQIDAALGQTQGIGARDTGGRGPAKTSSRRGPQRRPENSMTIAEAVAKVTAKNPLSIREIVAAVGKIGYKFASSNPVNSVGAYLYGAGKKQFKRADGKFSAK